MKITSLNINAFGKFIGKTLSFSDGVNVICGNNEAGKTTTHAFIKAMLFGIKKKKSKVQTDIYSKYMPWDSKNYYGGSLSFIYNDKEYQIYREFNETNQVFEIREITDKGKLIENPELFLNKVLHNLTTNSFDNTISIGQLKAAQDSSMIDELHRIIANLNTSGDMSIDTLYALKMLNQKKEILNSQLDKDATITYTKQLGSIRNIEKELENKRYENLLPSTQAKKSKEAKLINENNAEIDRLNKLIVDNSLTLESYGFIDEKDIDSLSLEASKIYKEYKPVLNNKKRMYSAIGYTLLIILGIISTVISTLLLVATYPDIANILKLHDTRYSMNGITNFLIHLPFHPIILISFLLCIGLILIFGNILLLNNIVKYTSSSSELKTVLSDIFNQHINTSEISNASMMSFKKHIKRMRELSKEIDNAKSNIILLTNENNDLLKKQTEYNEIIKAQQKIQYDVEQKYNELYQLKTENEKIKNVLNKNDILNADIESINLAMETIKSLSDEIQVAFGMHLNESASNYIDILTNGKYNSLSIDNALNTTINYDGKMIPLYKVSTGTIDQIYLAIRLSIIDIINRNTDTLPLIFDDCFAMYDDERLEATLKFLYNRINTQILIFTCHNREDSIFNKNNLPANKIQI